ncbi:hypothetical protein ES754_00405 [Psychrobacter frigidicola]|uniref:Formyl transferase N-terminal domain-containing protein n=1 Tax=Psychrobacter frigidicola TaxID=45611 RepID=A0A5C7A4D2_9GAMM|nr:formyltransferase family protein [Psychrobacter frigidicola]TXD97490.1 hypothetical protein ES754_00405 [Psychrobacter frigidicola]
MKYGFAGDRQLSVEILSFLINEGYKPSFLIVGDSKSSSHKQELIKISGLEEKSIYNMSFMNDPKNADVLNDYEVDYIFGIHFPYIIYENVLSIPKIGFLNLHPAYLPYNKGWHTPSWAIIDKKKYGATLHFMSEELDGGDIVAQAEIEVEPCFTANELYKNVLELEKKVFIDALPELVSLNPKRIQQSGKGTSYNKKALSRIQQIDMDNKILPLELIDKLRALTTNDVNEAAYFIVDGKKYSIQVNIIAN